MTPNLATLSDLVRVIDEWDQSGASTADLLERIRSVAARTLPELRGLRLYLLAGDSLRPLAATDHTANPDEHRPIEVGSVYEEALSSEAAVHHKHSGHYVVRLNQNGRAYGLLEAIVEPGVAVTHDIVWLTLAASHLGHVLRDVAFDDTALYTSAENREDSITLEEARLLYEVNSTLLTAEDEAVVLRTVRDYLARDAAAIRLYDATWDDETGEIVSMMQSWSLTPEGESNPGIEMLDVVGPEDVKAFKADWDAHGEDLDFIEDVEAILDERPAYRLAFAEGVRSSIRVPIFSDGRLTQQINIAYAAPRTFSPATRRLFAAARDQIAVVLQNQRLLREMQSSAHELGEQVHRLRLINELATTLSTMQDERILMDQTCLTLFNALKPDHVGITLVDPDDKTATVVSEYPETGAIGIKIEAHGGVQDTLREYKVPLVINNVDEDPGLEDMARAALQSINIKSVLLLPLHDTDGNYMGAIGLDIYELGRPFTPDMVTVAQTLSAPISVTLQNIRLVERTAYQAGQMERVAGFGQAIQTTLDVPALMEIALNNIAQIINAHTATVAFYDRGREVLSAVAAYDDGTVSVDLAAGPAIARRGTPIGRVWAARAALRIDNLPDEDGIQHHKRDDIRSLMVLPVFSRGAVLGAVEVGSREPMAYSDTDFLVFQQLTNMLVSAYENAEAYTQSQRLARSKALANDISSQLQRQVEIEQIMDVTMNELGKALGARRARIRLKADSASGNGDRGGAAQDGQME